MEPKHTYTPRPVTQTKAPHKCQDNHLTKNKFLPLSPMGLWMLNCSSNRNVPSEHGCLSKGVTT